MIKLPTLNKIFNKEVEKFRGQIYNYDISFYKIRLEDGTIVIPEYQRRDIWDLEQKQNFIRSLFYGIPIAPIVLNEREDISTIEDKISGKYDFSLYVVDGGQRIRTIQQFLNDELEVDGIKLSTGHPNLGMVFERIPLSCIKTSFKTEEEEKMYYRLFNTGGTPHSKEDIEKAL